MAFLQQAQLDWKLNFSAAIKFILVFKKKKKNVGNFPFFFYFFSNKSSWKVLEFYTNTSLGVLICVFTHLSFYKSRVAFR